MRDTENGNSVIRSWCRQVLIKFTVSISVERRAHFKSLSVKFVILCKMTLDLLFFFLVFRFSNHPVILPVMGEAISFGP